MTLQLSIPYSAIDGQIYNMVANVTNCLIFPPPSLAGYARSDKLEHKKQSDDGPVKPAAAVFKRYILGFRQFGFL